MRGRGKNNSLRQGILRPGNRTVGSYQEVRFDLELKTYEDLPADEIYNLPSNPRWPELKEMIFISLYTWQSAKPQITDEEVRATFDKKVKTIPSSTLENKREELIQRREANLHRLALSLPLAQRKELIEGFEQGYSLELVKTLWQNGAHEDRLALLEKTDTSLKDLRLTLPRLPQLMARYVEHVDGLDKHPDDKDFNKQTSIDNWRKIMPIYVERILQEEDIHAQKALLKQTFGVNPVGNDSELYTIVKGESPKWVRSILKNISAQDFAEALPAPNKPYRYENDSWNKSREWISHILTKKQREELTPLLERNDDKFYRESKRAYQTKPKKEAAKKYAWLKQAEKRVESSRAIRSDQIQERIVRIQKHAEYLNKLKDQGK